MTREGGLAMRPLVAVDAAVISTLDNLRQVADPPGHLSDRDPCVQPSRDAGGESKSSHNLVRRPRPKGHTALWLPASAQLLFEQAGDPDRHGCVKARRHLS